MPKPVWADFEGHYTAWRITRINKLKAILGEGWFKDKDVLELGCGYGHVGGELIKLGAKVTFAEGKKEYVDETQKRFPHSDVVILDNDTTWDLGWTWDLVIHWGLGYHLDNWKRDLTITCQHGKIISYETEVLDSKESAEVKVDETINNEPHKALHGVGTRPSCLAIENHIRSLGAKFTRHDDKDLNTEYFRYDWAAGWREGKWENGMRRFYIIYPKEDR